MIAKKKETKNPLFTGRLSSYNKKKNGFKEVIKFADR